MKRSKTRSTAPSSEKFTRKHSEKHEKSENRDNRTPGETGVRKSRRHRDKVSSLSEVGRSKSVMKNDSKPRKSERGTGSLAEFGHGKTLKTKRKSSPTSDHISAQQVAY